MEQLSNQFYALCERDENKIALEFKSTNNSTQEGMIGEALEIHCSNSPGCHPHDWLPHAR